MIVAAPASRAPAIAAQPTPPQPNTATESPWPTSPVNIAAPSPAITPQPSSPAAVGDAAASTFVHCPAATKVLSANAPMPSAGDSARAVGQRHLLRRRCASRSSTKDVRAGRHGTHHTRPAS